MFAAPMNQRPETEDGAPERGVSRRGLLNLSKALCAGAAAAAVVRPETSFAAGPLLRGLEDLKNGAEEELAYVIAMESYVYGFPLVMMDVTRAVTTATSKSGEHTAPLNQFARIRAFVDPDFKDVVRISRSSLWTFGFIDLEKEPFVYSQPDTSGRYIVAQALNMWTDDFASIGSRTTGAGAGNFLIAGPKWNGIAPSDVKAAFRCSTRYAWVLVQIAAAGPEDFPTIHKLQDQLQLTPLSAWGKGYTPPENVPVDPSADVTATPYDQVRLMTGEMFFKRLASLLKDNPPYAGDGRAVEKLRRIGVEADKEFDPARMNPAIVRGLNQAPAEVWLKLQAGPYEAPVVNGWLSPLNLGRYGVDYNTRALVAWLGLGALTSDDCVYPSAFLDADGDVLDASRKYVMHFEKGGLFPSDSGVWSISPYRENFYVRNSMERYAILSSMPIKYNPDGSLDIYIQTDRPGPDKVANWLPCPPSLPFNLTIRVYQPKKPLLDGSYKIPPVRKAT